MPGWDGVTRPKRAIRLLDDLLKIVIIGQWDDISKNFDNDEGKAVKICNMQVKVDKNREQLNTRGTRYQLSRPQ